MGSKRRIRRQRERQDQNRQESDLRKSTLAGGLGSVNQPLFGGTGRTSVADMVLQKHRFLQDKDKPQVQVVTPDKPLPGTAQPAPVQPAPTSPVGKITEEIVSEESRRHKEICTIAKQNQEFYLFACNGKEEPWFAFPRQQSQYSEYVMMTGPMAKACLVNIWQEDEGNRRIDRITVEKYKRDMLNGSWIPTDEAIGVDYQNRVYNGRHRLTAIKEIWDDGGNIEIPLYFTFNVLTTARFVIDSGRVRPLSDRLKLIVDSKLASNRIAGFCRSLMKGLGSKQVRYTESEVAAFAHKWEHVIDWIHTHLPQGRAEVQAVIAKAYLWYGPEKIEPFVERLREIKFSDDGDPARALFVALQRQRAQRINGQGIAYKKTLGAINALMLDKKIEKLYERDEDIFQWLPGWELPPKK